MITEAELGVMPSPAQGLWEPPGAGSTLPWGLQRECTLQTLEFGVGPPEPGE